MVATTETVPIASRTITDPTNITTSPARKASTVPPGSGSRRRNPGGHNNQTTAVRHRQTDQQRSEPAVARGLLDEHKYRELGQTVALLVAASGGRKHGARR